MALDGAAVAAMVKKDRGSVSQSVYARGLGLSQRQVSEVENNRIRRWSASVVDALRARFGPLPERTTVDDALARALPDSPAPNRPPKVPTVFELRRFVKEVAKLGEDHPIYRRMARDILLAYEEAQEIQREGQTFAKKPGSVIRHDRPTRKKRTP